MEGKVLKNALDVKQLDRKKRIRSQSQSINEMAMSFHALWRITGKAFEKMMERDYSDRAPVKKSPVKIPLLRYPCSLFLWL